MPISNSQRERVAQLIRDHFLALKVEVLGVDAIPRDDFERIVRAGILKHGAVEHSQVASEAAHTVGKLAANVSDTKLSRMSPEQFWMFVQHAPPQFSQHELDAIQAVRDHVGRAITKLGMGLLDEFDVAAHEEKAKARHEALGVVQHEIALGIARGSSADQIKRRLKRKLDEEERDWALVVATELHNAQDHGKALAMARDGHDPLVFKRPRPDACRYCKMLYLKGGRPRIFRLSTLVTNGSNVGRKAGRPSSGKTEWKPVIGSTHPACQCELHELPDGFTLDASGKMVPSVRKSLPDDLHPSIQALISHVCEA